MAASLESGAQTPISPGSPASLSTSSIPNIQQATPVSHNLKGANFHGSFAAITARHKTKHLHNRPWYRRYAYFTGGWGDRAIWRAGVSLSLYFSSSFMVTAALLPFDSAPLPGLRN